MIKNKFLANAMVNLNMIDTIGSGIQRMFSIQRKKLFPLPTYDLSNDSVKVEIFGKVMDINYAKILAKNIGLSLNDIILLDNVQKKKTIEPEAAKRLSFLPLVGVLGTIGAGVVSDKFFGGKRAPVNIICLSLLALCIYMFKVNTFPIMDYVYISAIGVFTCGPQVLIGGLSAVESSSKKVASAVTGFCGMFGYIGAILSGAGTGFIIDKFSWEWAINFWILSALLALAICMILLKKEIKK